MRIELLRRVLQQRADALHLLVDALDGGEDVVGRDRHVRHALRHRAHRAHDRALDREDAREVEAQHLGHREHAHRVAGRGAVDHDRVPAPARGPGRDPHQAEQLLHPGQDRDLLGHRLVDAAEGHEAGQELVDRAPVALELDVDVHLDRVEAGQDLAVGSAPTSRSSASRRLWAESVETTSVRWPSCDGADRRGRRQAGLADAALARIEDEPRLHRDAPAARARSGVPREDELGERRRARAGRGRPARARAPAPAARACPPRAARSRGARRARAPAARGA